MAKQPAKKKNMGVSVKRPEAFKTKAGPAGRSRSFAEKDKRHGDKASLQLTGKK